MRISNESLETIKKQFILDCNLKEAEEIAPNKVYLSKTKELPGARMVNQTDPFFRAIMFMDQVYIMADEKIYEGCREIFKNASPEWFCKFPNLRLIDTFLQDYGREIADTHIYFLPDEDKADVLETGSLIWLSREDIEKIQEYNPFHNALCYSPTQPDVIAVALLDEKEDLKDKSLIEKIPFMKGMAGASLDGTHVRQIGIDVRDAYRKEGVGIYLTTLLKQRIIKSGLLPFYGTSESHTISRSVAVKSGFLPAWCEIYVKRK